MLNLPEIYDLSRKIKQGHSSTAYFLQTYVYLLFLPASPMRPIPKRIVVVGSGIVSSD
jgi:hypothetical protein